MNKQDKQFEQLMKGMNLDSPSADFMHRVMGRIHAEAAVTPRKVLQDYQPVISRKTWIVLGVLFVALLVYITVSGSGSATESAPGYWSNLMGNVNSQEVGSVWQKGMNWIGSVPTLALLIVASTLALYTLDTYLTRMRHRTDK